MNESELVEAIINATDAQVKLVEAALNIRTSSHGSELKKQRRITDYPSGREWTRDRNQTLWSLCVDKKVTIKEASRQIGKTEAQTSAQLSKLRKWMNS